MKIINRFYPHALAILGFVVISLLYFYPVLQGKQIFQSDIVQYTGMAKEQNDFRATDDIEPYWTNSAFGGMPTYQLGAKYPHDYIGAIDDALRFLPRPADYLFLYFLGFYGLMLVLKVDPLKAFFGALAFGLSTYLIIILGVGHNAKAHAIAYMPLVIAGFILVFQKKYILGGLITLFATALEINANHFQMTYYLLIFLLILSAYFLYQQVKEKEYKSLLYSFGILAAAGILAIGANATNLLATSEYADFSIRGKSELTFNPNGSKNETTSSMSKDYITEYSYGVMESFNLIAPRLFGGSNNEAVGKDSNMYEFMIGQGVPEDQATDFVSGMPTYWGDQPIVAAPAYIGIVVFFLAILALFIDKRKIKYVFLSGSIVALVLSWGKNFPILTDFFIDYVPMYDKFRAVSSIQVVLELCFPVLAIMGLQSFFRLDKKLQWKALYETTILGLGIILILFLSKSMFSFSGGNDAYFQESYGPEFVNALKLDRMSLYSADLLRSGFFIVLTSGVLWLFIKDRFAQNTAIIIVGLLMVSDLFFVDKKYVSGKDFVSGSQVEVPFQESPSDTEILKDTANYRVFEVGDIMGARASYFHKSIGGYSAVRPRRMQQLIDYQISKNNIEVLNMLNVKYVIQKDKEGKEFPVSNPDVNGNAWFVSQVKLVNSADEEMKALDSLDSKNVAVVNSKDFQIKNTAFVKDSSATITLENYKPNYLKYVSNNSNEGLAVFSEMYYGKGWNAYIDGKSVDHIRVDYVLRALNIPAGKQTIEFKFEPQVIKTGSMITLISSIGMLLLLLGGIYFERKKKI
ncbi:YfhO family protein [Flavobacterium sinopsychrotolerans]|uniref:Membrane protein YfhO n=1 Tax=Flavobacterium sinopsychrotolerans TaxID=604089 RepID=A0A1H8P8N3_9FLAO|nr:YfhO family protein [Flavobacterium sinopsychrotolerans]SEO38309.1 membrane protein YfhO [Flavobacterium sinopsychrotolerans]